MNKYFSYLIKFIWLITFLLIVFIDRTNYAMVLITIFLLIFISSITIVRSLVSRNEWRDMIEKGEVKIKDKISFDSED